MLLVGGGVGIAPIYPIARALREAGNYVISIIGARNVGLLFWEDKMRSVSDELIVCTDDGSYGRKALVTEPMKEILSSTRKVNHIWAIGPAIMMKFCSLTSRPFGVKTVVSLNSIMVDGTACAALAGSRWVARPGSPASNGPEFDGHEVDWDLLISRQKMYLSEEKTALGQFERARAEHHHECACHAKSS